MLQLSPELLAYLRSTQAATDAKLAMAADNAGREKTIVRKLNQARRKHLIDRAADILRKGEASKFQFEAACRYGFRSSFCLQGWSWTEADLVAAEIVAVALSMIGAERPTWKEGQPEWTQDGVLRVERDDCIRCHDPLPEGHFKFCSAECGNAHRQELARRTDMEASNARVYAYFTAWSTKQPEQPCEVCETKFKPNRPGRRFCSIRCRNVRNAGLSRSMRKPLKCDAAG